MVEKMPKRLKEFKDKLYKKSTDEFIKAYNSSSLDDWSSGGPNTKRAHSFNNLRYSVDRASKKRLERIQKITAQQKRHLKK